MRERAILLFAIVIVPLGAVLAIMRAGNATQAAPTFAQVLAAQPDYRTLKFDIEIRGTEPTEVHAMAYRSRSAARLEKVGESITVINAIEGRLLYLDQRARTAIIGTLQPGWVEADGHPVLLQLADVQGDPEPIAESRRIDGQTCWGWKLRFRGDPAEVWANSAGRLCAIDIQPPGGRTVHFVRIRVDSPMDGSMFAIAVPQGYRPGTAPPAG
jgi:hypothetical protein